MAILCQHCLYTNFLGSNEKSIDVYLNLTQKLKAVNFINFIYNNFLFLNVFIVFSSRGSLNFSLYSEYRVSSNCFYHHRILTPKMSLQKFPLDGKISCLSEKEVTYSFFIKKCGVFKSGPSWDITFQLNRNYGLTAMNSDLDFPMDITTPPNEQLYSVPAQTLFSDKQLPKDSLYMQLNFEPNSSLTEFYFLAIRDPDETLRFALSMYKNKPQSYGVKLQYNLLNSSEGERVIDFLYPPSPSYWRLGVLIKADSVSQCASFLTPRCIVSCIAFCPSKLIKENRCIMQGKAFRFLTFGECLSFYSLINDGTIALHRYYQRGESRGSRQLVSQKSPFLRIGSNSLLDSQSCQMYPRSTDSSCALKFVKDYFLLPLRRNLIFS
ncbi:hypothetical protein EGR_09787 [Echinococcus granulosus]|uniref:Uncharacterized protein n=1 Tax=Echinococcus granulosus TaxID=6210 RepID=W6U2K9_ECHGR|nr:hypothetical protein EGR_09787 [Echinococcus granulosus]EUB55350.1 hypothetical protein EGR_09787 [Echinococcus granulosus]